MKNLALGAALLCLGSCGDVETIGRPRVRIMTVAPAGDGSIGDQTVAAVVLARAGVGSEFIVDVADDVIDLEDARAVFDRWRREGTERDLLVLGAPIYAPMVEEAECDFGGASVLLVGAPTSTCAKLRSVTYQAFEPSYLAGVAAVSDPAIAPEGRVGLIVGMDGPEAREIMVPFQLGVEAAGGTIVDTVFIGTDSSGFFDPARGGELARAMAPNVDVVFALAGPSGIGVGEALSALPEAERTYLISAETDYSTRFATITLGSILRRVDYTIRDAILEFIGGQLSSGNVEVGFRDRLTEFLLSPTYGLRPIGAGCEECDPFDAACLNRCATLVSIIEGAEAEARAAREAQ